MRSFAILGLAFISGVAVSQTINCNMEAYKPVSGVKAEAGVNSVALVWQGEGNEQLRARFAIRDGQPMVVEMAARAEGGAWLVLGKDLAPEFHVTTARRRISGVQQSLLKTQNNDTPEQENIRKWNTFWDAPLVMPGHHDSTDLPRKPEEIHRATGSFQSTQCTVATEGARVSVTFNGLTLGVFAGDLVFTAYKGSNLLRQEAVAKTNEESVAYLQGRPQGLFHPERYQGGVAGYGAGLGGVPLRRCSKRGTGQPAGTQPLGDPGRGSGVTGGAATPAQVLLRA